MTELRNDQIDSVWGGEGGGLATEVESKRVWDFLKSIFSDGSQGEPEVQYA